MNSKYGLDECNRVILMMLCRYRGNHNKTPNEPKLNSKHYKKERQVSRDFIHFQFIWQRTISFINRVWGFLVKNGRNLESKFVDTFPFDNQNVLAFLIKFEEIIKMYIAVICNLWICIHCMFTCSFYFYPVLIWIQSIINTRVYSTIMVFVLKWVYMTD